MLDYSDGNPTYLALLNHPSIHLTFTDKCQTYRVEGDNAELRRYLARLVCRSRCFSRCLIALAHAVKRFVYAWNRQPLYQQAYPHSPAHVMAFVYP
ncbi:MAG: IS1 transposase [Anaerolineae bacterium]|nr:IS1 transposase [Anaerolineae bacterium]